MSLRAVIVVGGILLGLTRTSHAQLELKNDGFDSGESASFQGGFVTSEIGAARFNAPDATRSLVKVQLLFGPEVPSPGINTRTVTLKVWDDSAGTDAPGAEIFSGDFSLQGSSSALSEMVLPVAVAVPTQFRVGVLFQHDGAPSIAGDADGTHTASNNFIFAGSWFKAATFGLTRDWVIRAFVTDGGSGTPDGAPSGDAGATGGPCSSNAQCPTGQFCDTAAGSCTFECRVDDDCGGGSCNSLGQCVGGSDGGGCCQTDRSGGELGVLVLGLGVAALVLTRRRRRCCE